MATESAAFAACMHTVPFLGPFVELSRRSEAADDSISPGPWEHSHGDYSNLDVQYIPIVTPGSGPDGHVLVKT